MADRPPELDLTTFREDGYLAEVNRRILHPLGLALAVDLDDDGKPTRLFVYDDRGDEEGSRYVGDEMIPLVADAADKVAALEAERAPARMAALGYWVQPVDAVPSTEDLLAEPAARPAKVAADLERATPALDAALDRQRRAAES